MAELMPDIVDEVVAACRAAADEIVGALTRSLDAEIIGVTIGEAATYDAAEPPAGFDGPGLAIVLRCGAAGVVALLPASSGMLPSWYAEPDPTGKSKLSTLAQEMAMLVMPASLAVDEFHAQGVSKLADILARSEVAAAAALVPVTLKSGDKQGQLSILWPVAKPAEAMPKSAAPDAKAEPAAAPQPAAPASKSAADAPPSADLSQMPKHTRSFFKVQVPVSVNLASQKQSVKDIIELVPGAIIKFDKSCDELLELMVGDQPVAAGEVVKVGDKFGLRIRNIILPQEQFVAVKATMSS